MNDPEPRCGDHLRGTSTVGQSRVVHRLAALLAKSAHRHATVLILADWLTEPVASSDVTDLGCCAVGGGRRGVAWPKVLRGR
jgi:hypothetical protein